MSRVRFALCAMTLAASASAAPRKKSPPAKPQATPSPSPTSGTRDYVSPDEPPATDPPGAVHAEGDYGGVVPGQPQRSDKGKVKRAAPKGTLTWIGFEAKNGGAEVFFQSVAPFELAQHVEGGQLVIELGGLARLGQNTWRPVDTRFFDNPLAKIAAARVGASRGSKDHAAHGAGIEIRIAFKNAKDAKEGAVRSATEADGMYYAYLDFAEGADPAPTTAADPEH